MKKLITGLMLAGMVSAANASVVSLAGGLTLTQDTDIDVDQGNGNFNSTFDFIQWWDNTATADAADSISTLTALNASDFVLNGIGEIDVDTTGTGKIFCASCELTFEFGGIGLEIVSIVNPVIQALIDGGSPLSSADLAALLGVAEFVGAPSLTLGNAFLNVYLDNTPDLDFGSVLNAPDNAVDATEIANATNDTLWLELSFNESFFNPASLTDGVFGLSDADAFFSFNIEGGLAADNFQQDGIRFLNQGLTAFEEILGLGLTATFAIDGGTGQRELYASGTAGNFTGIAVPEPSSIAVFGLSLLGLGLAGRRRKNK